MESMKSRLEQFTSRKTAKGGADQPMQEIHIREVLSQDLPRVTELNEQAVPAVNSVLETFFRRYAVFDQSPPDGLKTFRVAVDRSSDQVVGFLLCLRSGGDYDSENYRWFSRRFDDFLYVDRIVISPKAQGRGLGTRFYRDLVELARTSEPAVRRICCEVNLRPRNEQSLAFHRQFGFQQQGTQETDGGKKLVSLLTYPVAGCSFHQ